METTSGNLASALKIEPGITAIIGSGGKSTLLKTLGLELMRAGGRVLLCTTTHMFPVAGVPWGGSSRRLDAVPWKPGALHVPGCTCEACAGMSRGGIRQAGVLDPETGKLSSPAEPLDQLAQRFDYVLAEADGSKRLPLKAHAAWEPVIPSGTANIVWIAGASGLGKPINEAVHRPELFCERCGCEPTDIATPENVAQVLSAEMQALKLGAARVMLNQVDTLADSTMADRFEAALDRPVVASSLK
jgi:probable selenium-dependent hydroxylase accessory protein YqeC